MADASKYDTLKTGRHVGQDSAIITVSGVNSGGTIARVGDWVLFPEEDMFKFGREVDTAERSNRTGAKIKEQTLVGFRYISGIWQRDADSFDFDLTYAGVDCVLLVKMHYFRKLSSPKQQWLAIFGTVEMHGEDVASEDGKIPFRFQGLPNKQAIVLTSTPASGKITYPTGAGVTGWTSPSSDITIPAYTGAAGIYDIVDL